MNVSTIFAAYVFAVSMKASAQPQENARENLPFKFFDATLYRKKPPSFESRFSKVKVFYGELWGPDKKYKQMPPVEVLSKLRMQIPKGTLVVFDLESWPFNTDRDATAESLARTRRLTTYFRETATDSSFAVYGLLPLNDYWTSLGPTGSPAYASWRSLNNTIYSELSSSLDALTPSLYAYFDDVEAWQRFAIAHICEGRRLSNKPIYAFIWPEFHDSNKQLQGHLLSRVFWRAQLETLWNYADGAVIWGGWDTTMRRPRDWDASAEWWQETLSFMNAMQKTPKLRSGVCPHHYISGNGK